MIFPLRKTPLRAVMFSLALVCHASPAAAQPAPHFPHESRFGGIFAAAAGDTLHLEGVWAAQRRFKLLVVDASGSPLSIERLREMQGTALAAGREFPLLLLEADGYFEARIPTLTIPAAIGVQFRPSAAASIERLTFTFAGYTIDTSGDTTEAPIEIPDTLSGIADALRVNLQEAKGRIDRDDSTALIEFEHRARELVMAVEPFMATLPPASRRRAEAARLSAIRGAWLLHNAFDYGNNAQLLAAFSRLSIALDELLAVIGSAAP